MAKLKKSEAFIAFDEGKRPSNLKGMGLSNKSLYTYFQQWKKERGIVNGSDGSNQGTTTTTTKPTPVVPQKATKMQLIPKTMVVDFTPTMLVAFNAAVDVWGIPSDTRFDDFLDVVLDNFFLDRGIKLGGYIVISDQEEKENGEQVSIATGGEEPA